MSTVRTLYDKVFDDHIVIMAPDGTATMYIDRHIVHEVTSPQAFEGLRLNSRKVRRNDCTLATVDHNVPTENRTDFKDSSSFIKEADSRLQVVTLEENVQKFGLNFFGMTDKRQGIVHVIGPEQGFTLPGATIVCGDSHTSTHGAFGALAFGIGTSEVEHVLATQTILQTRSLNMRVQIDGPLAEGVTSKDVILHTIGVIGTAGGTGAVIEFCGTTVEQMSMEGRMSICNMTIEAGARAGMIAPDEITFEYLKGRPLAPAVGAEWDKAVAYWKTLKSDAGAHFDRSVTISSADISPTVSWGTSPQDVVSITGTVPDPANAKTEAQKASIERAIKYMGLEAGMKMEDVKIDKVFIGSCTNSRIEDLRSAATVIVGRKVLQGIYAMVVPGSGLVKLQAESEGLDQIFINAGFDWREAGCSMCLGMNPDMLSPGERCASTSNRNFEGRQGPGGRTHLMSPAMAAAAAITGHLTDARTMAPIRSIAGEKKATHVPVISSVQTSAVAPVSTSTTPSSKRSTTASSVESSMPKFVVLKGIAAPIERANIDTDLIIPARFLKTIKRTGLGVSLFSAIRYDSQTGEERSDFILNQGIYRSSKILVVKGGNFGCGSSREHAPWALLDFGIRVVIASSFADIFNNNMYKNGSLPVVLPESTITALLEDAKAGLELEVDLPAQVVRRSNGEEIRFEVEEFRKHCLVNGLDDISLTLKNEDKIEEFEVKRSAERPWLDGIGYLGKIPLAPQDKKLDW